MSTGLLVPSVLGMRHISYERQVRDTRIEGALGAYVYDLFNLDDGVLPVFSVAALMHDARFLTAAQ
jgi:hypothetical protein